MNREIENKTRTKTTTEQEIQISHVTNELDVIKNEHDNLKKKNVSYRDYSKRLVEYNTNTRERIKENIENGTKKTTLPPNRTPPSTKIHTNFKSPQNPDSLSNIRR